MYKNVLCMPHSQTVVSLHVWRVYNTWQVMQILEDLHKFEIKWSLCNKFLEVCAMYIQFIHMQYCTKVCFMQNFIVLKPPLSVLFNVCTKRDLYLWVEGTVVCALCNVFSTIFFVFWTNMSVKEISSGAVPVKCLVNAL